MNQKSIVDSFATMNQSVFINTFVFPFIHVFVLVGEDGGPFVKGPRPVGEEVVCCSSADQPTGHPNIML
jgi:hypothetical protein